MKHPGSASWMGLGRDAAGAKLRMLPRAITSFTLTAVASILYNEPCSNCGSVDAGAKIVGDKGLVSKKFRGFRSFRWNSGSSGAVPEIPDRFRKTY